MRKNVLRRIVTPIAVIVCLATLCVSLSGCLIIPRSSYDLSLERGDSAIGEWISNLTGDSEAEDSKQVVAGDVNSITIEAGDGDGTQFAIAKGLLSTVSIVSNFTVVTGGGWYGRETTSKKSSGGAGVIIELDKELGNALIVTNYHVVYEVSSSTSNHISDDISVYLYGSETYLSESGENTMAIPATYIGGSMNYDIAVLYVENNDIIRRSDAQTVTFADSNDIRVGQTIFTVGNQKGYGIAATRGIISKESQTITMTAVDEVSTVSMRVIRVDAAINAGSSGGGLFNEAGELIGIVNAKNIETNVDNIGYAIPSNIAKAIAQSVLDYCVGTSYENPIRAFLGITLDAENPMSTYNTETGFVDIVEDVRIASVSSGSLASGSLKVGDVIKSVAIGDKTVETKRTFYVIDTMLNARAGDTVTVTVERDGAEKTFSFTITESDLSIIQ